MIYKPLVSIPFHFLLTSIVNGGSWSWLSKGRYSVHQGHNWDIATSSTDHEIITQLWPVTLRLLDMHESSQVGREIEIVSFLGYA